MPHRRLVQIGQKPQPKPPENLPTVADYFRDLAQRQGEDIKLLKQRAQALLDEKAARRSTAATKRSVREESWRLHPMVPKAAKKRKTARKRVAAKKRSR